MAQFKITLLHPPTNQQKFVYYDNALSTLRWEDGSDVMDGCITQPPREQVKIEEGKKPTTIKILLGLSCNYECDYCNQRFVPHAEETNQNDIAPFLEQIPSWFTGGYDGLGGNTRFEFWGGEPLVYWKTLKPLAEKLRAMYPNTGFSMITNGSLLDDEKNEWLDRMGFRVAVSHDGPGQYVRGPDPFDEPKSKHGILSLFKKFAPEKRFSFNTMLHNKNYSRVAIEQYFEKLITENLGVEYLQHLRLGEGAFIDAYDIGGSGSSLQSEEEQVFYRNGSYKEIRESQVKYFNIVPEKSIDFLESIQKGTPKEALGQKCGMDKSDTVAIDMLGNVLTCQNVSTVSVNPAGISHHLGHVSDLDSVKVNTGTHWSDRDECPNCPVLHLCKGACFFLTGPLWETTCNNAFSDNVAIFAAAIEVATGGWVPIYIDGALRESRKDIFWWVNGKPEKTSSKKVIPILAI